MSYLTEVIKDYKEVLNFNQKSLEVVKEYQNYIKKIDKTGPYNENYLVSTKLIDTKAKISHNYENHEINFHQAKIYYYLEIYPELFYLGFSLILLLKNDTIGYHLKIASTKIDQFELSPISINKLNLVIAQDGIKIKFSSRKQLAEITNFCNETINDFNINVDKKNCLVKNPKNL